MGQKTFKALTAKEALSQISRELGPDAIIVSHRKIRDSNGQIIVEATAFPRVTRASDPAAFPIAAKSVFNRKKIIAIGGLAAMCVLIAAAAILFWPRGGTRPNLKEKRLVVLPFENLGLPEDTYFADGITDEITSRLSKIEGLGVIARTSANLYKNNTKTLREIGDELGVDYVLEGAIRWQKSSDDPGRVRLTPQLIRVSDATHVWTHIYEKDISDIFKIQSEIAEHVAEALDITLNRSERQSLKAMPTGNLEAYNYHLRGNDYFKRGHELWNIRSAIQMYEKAVELDPTFALAYAWLSYSHSRIYGLHHDRTKERLNNAKQAVDTAFKIIPDMPEAHWALGYYYNVQNDLDRALEHLKIAQENMQRDSELLSSFSDIQAQQGKFEQALVTLKKAFELDPHSSILAYQIVDSYRGLDNYPEAERYYDLAISLAPENNRPYSEKAELYILWEGSTEKARKVFRKAPNLLRSQGEVRPTSLAIQLDVFDGNYQEALDRLSSQSRDIIDFRANFLPIAQLRAQIYLLMNQLELAKSHFESARRLVEVRIQEQPENARIHGSLGIIYAGLGRKEEAIREGRLLVKLSDDIVLQHSDSSQTAMNALMEDVYDCILT